MGRAEGGELGPDHLGPRGLGKGFGFYSKYIWQLLGGFKGYALFNFIKR